MNEIASHGKVTPQSYPDPRPFLVSEMIVKAKVDSVLVAGQSCKPYRRSNAATTTGFTDGTRKKKCNWIYWRSKGKKLSTSKVGDRTNCGDIRGRRCKYIRRIVSR